MLWTSLFLLFPLFLAENTLYVPKGTVVKLHLVQSISSATAKLGDPVDLEVAEDVKINGTLVIAKGSKAQGWISEAMPARLWGAGQLGIYVGSAFTPAGFRIPLHGVVSENSAKDVTMNHDTEIVASTEIDIPLPS